MIILFNKTCKCPELLFVIQKPVKKIPLTFCRGKQGDAYFKSENMPLLCLPHGARKVTPAVRKQGATFSRTASDLCATVLNDVHSFESCNVCLNMFVAV